MLPRVLYFVDRGRDCPDWHKVPYHRYLICTNLPRAVIEAGDSSMRANIWEHTPHRDGSGWLLRRWRGLDVDYGHIVRGGDLLDGGRMGFEHNRDAPPWSLLNKAVWWSERQLPRWLMALGVDLPKDDYSRNQIREGSHRQHSFTKLVANEEAPGVLADWLEQEGFAEAAAALRKKFCPPALPQPVATLFGMEESRP